MTKKSNKKVENTTDTFYKLSIQVSLNGLSFCVVDTLRNAIVASDQRGFGKELSPYEVQKELKEMLVEQGILEMDIAEMIVVHHNKLFSLVPKDLFDSNELANYLKFNAKILVNDLIEYDEIEGHDMVNVYVPYVNINNYLFEHFGEFEFVHSGTVLLQSLLKSVSSATEPVCYVHVGHRQMDMVILSRKQLYLYNSFQFDTKEDFIYYILFTLEQLDMDPETIPLRLFGHVKEGDEIYNVCYEFVRHISIFIQDSAYTASEDQIAESLDFAVLNAI